MTLHDNARVSVELDRHGRFSCSGYTLDAMIRKHLPASPEELRRKIGQETGLDYSDVCDVGALLIVLGDLHAYEYGDTGA